MILGGSWKNLYKRGGLDVVEGFGADGKNPTSASKVHQFRLGRLSEGSDR